MAKAERLNGLKPRGKSDGLKFIPGETIPRREHPRRARDFAEFTKLKATVAGEPGPATEEEMIRMLRFERQSKDAALFREAMAAESISWGRGR